MDLKSDLIKGVAIDGSDFIREGILYMFSNNISSLFMQIFLRLINAVCILNLNIPVGKELRLK